MFSLLADNIKFGFTVPWHKHICSGKRGHSFLTKNMATSCSASVKGSLICSFTSVKELIESNRHKVWLLDQFGVLHDGKKPYPGVTKTYTTLERMGKLGFNPSLFAGAITSGELTHQFLLWRNESWFAKLGTRCIHMTWSERGAISLEGLNLQIVESVEEADFILAHGTEALGLPDAVSVKPMHLEEFEPILRDGAKKGIPMIVANPDHVTVEARALRVMPGTLGSMYESFGGQVRWMGKPDQVIYNAAKQMTGVNMEECIAVGDSLHHDILGANKAGIESVFVVGGIHANELGIHQMGDEPNVVALEALTKKYGAYPTFVVNSFAW
eukprot:TRINITY_DN13266_c0_g1_i1.p1 TRINITY_DN13266_c0_g1~~TRINITY_DN13266_c0_g1_i1.p1  ORF type:complete len:327 (+),score=60.72 TRINITY_DN13266_c0_g1_i1:442-1422(+)